MSEWIPVTKDRPYPETKGNYLVTVTNRDYVRPTVLIAWCGPYGEWESDDFLRDDIVEAWMELPEPYMEDKR